MKLQGVWATLALLLLLVLPTSAQAGFGQPPPPPTDGTAQSTPQATSHQTSSDAQAAPAPSPNVTTRCATNKRTHVKTCRTYVAGALIKVCTKKPKKKAVCKTVGVGGGRVFGLARPLTSRMADAFGLPAPGPWAFRPSAVDAAQTFSGWGIANPLLPAVVRLYKNGSPVPDNGWCSGVLVRRGIVLTAAHCLYDNTEEDQPGALPGFYAFKDGDMQVVPGNTVQNGSNVINRYGTWNVDNVFVPKSYLGNTSQSDITTDWGLMILAPDATGKYAGDYAGTYTASWNVGGINTSTPLYATGYPATGLFRTAQYHYGENQYFCKTNIDSVRTDLIFGSAVAYWLQYPCYMNGGSSGGPVFAQLSDGSWTITGVTNRGAEFNAGQVNSYGNFQLSLWFDDRFGDFWNGVLAALG